MLLHFESLWIIFEIGGKILKAYNGKTSVQE